jgi:hypothetical protein
MATVLAAQKKQNKAKQNCAKLSPSSSSSSMSASTSNLTVESNTNNNGNNDLTNAMPMKTSIVSSPLSSTHVYDTHTQTKDSKSNDGNIAVNTTVMNDNGTENAASLSSIIAVSVRRSKPSKRARMRAAKRAAIASPSTSNFLNNALE